MAAKKANIISFSGRASEGNCLAVAKLIQQNLPIKSTIFDFKKLSYDSCSFCEYECLTNLLCSKEDGFNAWVAQLINQPLFVIIPPYCGSFSSLWQTFNERLQGYFCNLPEKHFHSLFAVCLSNSNEILIQDMLKEQIGLKPTNVLCLSSNEVDSRGVDDDLMESEMRKKLLNFLGLDGYIRPVKRETSL